MVFLLCLNEVNNIKQPKVKLFDKVWDVLELKYDRETGELDVIIYKEFGDWSRIVVQGDVEKPIVHPYQDYVIAPNLNDLFVEA